MMWFSSWLLRTRHQHVGISRGDVENAARPETRRTLLPGRATKRVSASMIMSGSV